MVAHVRNAASPTTTHEAAEAPDAATACLGGRLTRRCT